jgi:hypothetical protein
MVHIKFKKYNTVKKVDWRLKTETNIRLEVLVWHVLI